MIQSRNVRTSASTQRTHLASYALRMHCSIWECNNTTPYLTNALSNSAGSIAGGKSFLGATARSAKFKKFSNMARLMAHRTSGSEQVPGDVPQRPHQLSDKTRWL